MLKGTLSKLSDVHQPENNDRQRGQDSEVNGDVKGDLK